VEAGEDREVFGEGARTRAEQATAVLRMPEQGAPVLRPGEPDAGHAMREQGGRDLRVRRRRSQVAPQGAQRRLRAEGRPERDRPGAHGEPGIEQDERFDQQAPPRLAALAIPASIELGDGALSSSGSPKARRTTR
jgi:hypothetical protein